MRVAEILRDRIIALIDKGIIPWRRPWSVAGPARNAAGRPYRGINVWLLNGTREGAGYDRNAWATYRDVASRGWTVRKGEHGTPVLFWKVNSYLKTVKDAAGEQHDETARGFVMRYRERVPRAEFLTFFAAPRGASERSAQTGRDLPGQSCPQNVLRDARRLPVDYLVGA